MRLIARLVLLALIAAGCESERKPIPGPQVRPTGQITVAYPEEPAGLDPYLVETRSNATLDLLRPVLPTLLTVRPDRSYGPGIASVPRGADVAKDRSRVTFKIMPQAVWSDGVTITADDVAFTLGSIMDGKLPIADRSGYDRIAKFVRKGPRSFTLHFDGPFPGYRDLFSAGDFILPKHLLEGKDLRTQMLGDVGFSGGPFSIERWTRGLGIDYVANPRWWGTGPRLERVAVRFVSSIDTAVRLMREERVDVVVSSSQVGLIRRLQSGSTQISSRYGMAWWELVFNVQRLPDEKIRRGLAAAIDRGSVIEALYKDNAKPIDSPMPGMTPPASAPYPYDLAKARADLEAGGSVKTGNGLRLPTGRALVVCASGSHEVPATFQRALQVSLDSIGVQVELRNHTAAAVYGTWFADGRCDAYILERRGTSSTTLSSLYRGRASDADLDAKLALADRSEAEEVPAAIRIAELVPSVPLAEVQMVIAARGVAGPQANATVDGPFWNLAAWRNEG